MNNGYIKHNFCRRFFLSFVVSCVLVVSFFGGVVSAETIPTLRTEIPLSYADYDIMETKITEQLTRPLTYGIPNNWCDQTFLDTLDWYNLDYVIYSYQELIGATTKLEYIGVNVYVNCDLEYNQGTTSGILKIRQKNNSLPSFSFPGLNTVLTKTFIYQSSLVPNPPWCKTMKADEPSANYTNVPYWWYGNTHFKLPVSTIQPWGNELINIFDNNYIGFALEQVKILNTSVDIKDQNGIVYWVADPKYRVPIGPPIPVDGLPSFNGILPDDKGVIPGLFDGGLFPSFPPLPVSRTPGNMITWALSCVVSIPTMIIGLFTYVVGYISPFLSMFSYAFMALPSMFIILIVLSVALAVVIKLIKKGEE